MHGTYKVLKFKDGKMVVEAESNALVSDRVVAGYIDVTLMLAEKEINKCKELISYFVEKGLIDSDYLKFLQYSSQRVLAVRMKMTDPNTF